MTKMGSAPPSFKVGPLALLARGEPPDWAVEWGVDAHGVFVAFAVEDTVYRLRRIQPSQSSVDPPHEEAQRENSQRLRRGYWLGETPVPQALWIAVMGGNPSRFVDPDRPVENVSFGDCQDFCARLAKLVPGLRPSLPTEAHWEFACRANSKNATWVGDPEIRGECDAPLLDDICWYSGNSGVDYDLELAENASHWANRQYQFERAGTRRVGSKQPNPWGLQDMLGNVLEWCLRTEDGGGEGSGYKSASPLDTESELGACRGGSWRSPSRHIGASYSLRVVSHIRSDDLGFRLACLRDWPVELDCSLPIMVKIRAGDLLMGFPQRAKKVVLSHSFLMSEGPVTVSQYHSLLGGERRGPEPVVMVSWWDAVAYCNALSESQGLKPAYRDGLLERGSTGYRLPTETEWEYACRAGTKTAYWSGDSREGLARIAWYNQNSGRRLLRVDWLEANPWGLVGMHGGVWEWCHDSWRSWGLAGKQNLLGTPDDALRVLRGGSYLSDANDCASARRHRATPDHRDPAFGFRVVRTLPR